MLEMEVTLKKLSNNDLPQLQELLERSSDYLAFQDEEPVKPSAAQELFEAKPDGDADSDKVIFGIFLNQDNLIGVFDLIKGYSGPKTLSLGLMLLDPCSRGRGIGKRAYKLLEEWATTQQFNKIRLGVLMGNENGLRFWQSVGYKMTGEVKTKIRLSLSKEVLVFEKSITDHKIVNIIFDLGNVRNH